MFFLQKTDYIRTDQLFLAIRLKGPGRRHFLCCHRPGRHHLDGDLLVRTFFARLLFLVLRRHFCVEAVTVHCCLDVVHVVVRAPRSSQAEVAVVALPDQ